MEYESVVDSRYSCRAFADRPVSREQVEWIAAQAGKSPSWGNTQPWKLYAVGGDQAVQLRRSLQDCFRAGQKPEQEIPAPESFRDPLGARYKELGKALFTELGIGRGDAAAREAHYLKNFDAFGAPCLLFITMPRDQGNYTIFDAGAYVHGLCLAAAAQGLATIILSALVRFPQQVRAVAPIPDEEILVIGVALGYPDALAAGSRFRSQRASLSEVLTTFGI